MVEVLLGRGCDAECADGEGRTALRAAAWSGHGAVVARLVAAGARVDRADADGRTPLIAAAYMGHAGIVRALLDAGASIDHADDDGTTATTNHGTFIIDFRKHWCSNLLCADPSLTLLYFCDFVL